MTLETSLLKAFVALRDMHTEGIEDIHAYRRLVKRYKRLQDRYFAHNGYTWGARLDYGEYSHLGINSRGGERLPKRSKHHLTEHMALSSA